MESDGTPDTQGVYPSGRSLQSVTKAVNQETVLLITCPSILCLPSYGHAALRMGLPTSLTTSSPLCDGGLCPYVSHPMEKHVSYSKDGDVFFFFSDSLPVADPPLSHHTGQI